MAARENILKAIRQSQTGSDVLPILSGFRQDFDDDAVMFAKVLTGLGGNCQEIGDLDQLVLILKEKFPDVRRVVSTLSGLLTFASAMPAQKAHDLADIDVAIISGHFGVAENGSVWITEELMGDRVLPFICQNLVVIINRKDIVRTMHDAYDRIGEMQYDFGSFIAGPSKTADIEQSLVLGAHGAKTMNVFLMKETI